MIVDVEIGAMLKRNTFHRSEKVTSVNREISNYLVGNRTRDLSSFVNVTFKITGPLAALHQLSKYTESRYRRELARGLCFVEFSLTQCLVAVS